MDPDWLRWAKRIQALAQNGLTYSTDPYDVERYEALRDIAAEMMASRAGADLAHVRGLFAGEVGYTTPKVDVRGAVFRDGALLLVRERSDGLWTLPGGWADVGESPAEATVREVYEESGYRTRASKLLAVYDRDLHGHTPLPFYVYKLFFRCDLDDNAAPRVAGLGAAFGETDGVAFFREDELPELSITRVTPGQLHRCFAHYHHPDWPTDFD